jgi:GNAT superfamily N-acetyltransferase
MMMKEVTIRECQPSDYIAITSMLRAIGHEIASVLVLEKIELSRLNFTDRVFVATVQGEVVGSITLHAVPLFHANGYIGRVTSFLVDVRYRTQGVDSALLAAGECWFRSIGCVQSEVCCNLALSDCHRLDVQRFFEKHGFLLDEQRLSKQLIRSVPK